MKRARPPGRAGPGVHGDQLAGGGAGVEATEPDLLLAGAGAGDDLAGQLGGDGAVAVEVRRLVAGAEQGGVGHHQAERDRHGDVVAAAVRVASVAGRRPRTESTRVSAMSWPWLRGSPAARAVSAARVSAA